MAHFGAGGTGYANERTEWEETLMKHRIGPYQDMEPLARPGPAPFVNEDEMQAAEKEKRMAKASIAELDELEDDEG
jgi:hypothetical protein